MKAGRELDQLVTEKVMGSPKHRWICGITQRDILGDYEGCEICETERRHDRETEVCLQPYSTDIAAAWLVVEKFPEMELLKGMDGKWLCSFNPLAGARKRIVAEAETAPLAICLAALPPLVPTEHVFSK